MNAHSPLPWNVSESVETILRDSDGSFVGQTYIGNLPSIAEANAALIVRAVNNIDAVVEFLRRVEQYEGGEHLPNQARELLKRIDAR